MAHPLLYGDPITWTLSLRVPEVGKLSPTHQALNSQILRLSRTFLPFLFKGTLLGALTIFVGGISILISLQDLLKLSISTLCPPLGPHAEKAFSILWDLTMWFLYIPGSFIQGTRSTEYIVHFWAIWQYCSETTSRATNIPYPPSTWAEGSYRGSSAS